MQVQISVVRLPFCGLGLPARSKGGGHGGGQCDEGGAMRGWFHGIP